MIERVRERTSAEGSRPAERLTGRELLRMIDRKRQEELNRGTWRNGYPARSWRFDPRYG